MSTRYRPPALLAADHVTDRLECRSSEQTTWLHRHTRQPASTGTTRVFVVTPHNSNEVVTYYAWLMAHLEVGDAPQRLRKGAGRYPQPIALLARLGVDVRHEGRGLGAALLQDVVARLLELSDDIGCRGLLIHAESEDARLDDNPGRRPADTEALMVQAHASSNGSMRKVRPPAATASARATDRNARPDDALDSPTLRASIRTGTSATR